MSNKREKPISRTGNDPYRDSFIRLFGFSHVVGQTTEYIVCRPNFTKLCTGVSLLYCVSDAYDKFCKASNEDLNARKAFKIKKTSCKSKSVIIEPNPWKPYIAAGKAIVWQSLASYLLPAFAVSRITYVTKRILKRITQDQKLRLFLPPIIGIASIPFIMTPIDKAVTKLMEFAEYQKTDFVNDTYRDTYIRLLGYAFVISKASYPGLQSRRQLIDLCYGVSVLYSFADCIDKCNKAYGQADILKTNTNSGNLLKTDYKYQTIVTAVDVLIWQSLASFLIPGLILRNVNILTRRAIKLAKFRRGRVKHILPPIVALATIPFIIIPIDRIVDGILNDTFRKLF